MITTRGLSCLLNRLIPGNAETIMLSELRVLFIDLRNNPCDFDLDSL